ncbi:MAG: hypothetical protein ACR2K3_13200 [Nocardioides sp.]
MRPLISLLAVLVAGTLAAGPAHGSGTSSSAQQDPPQRAAHTHRVVVRPVDANGHRVTGWSVSRLKGSASCDGASPAAVDDGIVTCFPTAYYLPACWKSRHHTALCLRDARTRKLVRVRYTGSFGSGTAPQRPSPLDLDLARGQQCDLRFGGAWSQLPSHPEWVGFYSCDHGSVYGPPSGDGVNRTHPRWSVHVWKSGTKQRVVTRRVRTAYVVGTAT